MDNKKKALGRGLEQLFSNENIDFTSFEKSVYDSISKEEITEIPLDEIRPNPYQPRKTFNEEALQELASSIREHGIFQPVIVKKSIKGFDLIAGERRVRAAKLAGMEKIPAIIRELTDIQMMEIALLENLQRENLNVMEEAEAYKAMIEKLSLTQEQLALKVGKSRSHITNILGLLRLPESVRQLVMDDKISMGHARMLSKLENKEQIEQFADKIMSESLTVREIEQIASDDHLERKNKINKVVPKKEDYHYVEELLKEKLDTKVKIKERKIEITFTNTADLNRILEVLHIEES